MRCVVHIVSRKKLVDYCKANKRKDAPAVKSALDAWFHEVKRSSWKSPSDIKKKYASASILPNDRVVFNISGNKYRLVAIIRYRAQRVFIRFIGTHKEYDKINATEV